MPNANNETTRKSVRYLRPGMLVKATTVEINRVPTPGNFKGKVDLPFILEGQQFVLSISENHPDFQALESVWGEDRSSWVGRRLKVEDGQVLKGVCISPVG